MPGDRVLAVEDPTELLIWEALVTRGEELEHRREKSRATMIANAVWDGVK